MRRMAKTPLSPFAARLQKLRESAGISQQSLATSAKISISSLAQIEQGKRADPRLSTILGLARALGVKPSKLIDGLAEV